MRLTQKELDKFISKQPRKPGLLEETLGDAFFEPLSDDELTLWNCKNECPKIIESFNTLITKMNKTPIKPNESIYTDEELEGF